MKMILMSDWHLVNENPIGRSDNVVDVQWEKLRFVFDYAVYNRIHLILQAGDMTDTKRSWELLQKLSSHLSTYKMVKVLMVKGQHDSYYHDVSNQKTIVGVLESSKLVTVLNNKPYNAGYSEIEGATEKRTPPDVEIYGSSYGEDIPEVINSKSINILVIHKQILVSKIFAQQEDYVMAPTFLKENPDFDLVLCGDVHQRFEERLGERIICNTGPLLRLEATAAMMEHKPGFFVYDTQKKGPLKWIEIPSAGGSSILSRDHIEKQKKREMSFESFIERVQESTDDKNSVSFEKNLEIIMGRNKSSKNVRSLVAKYLAEDNPKEK